MAIRHGNKTYLQILLDPNRAKLLTDLADQSGIRPSAWVRNAVYKMIEEQVEQDIYAAALELDKAAWQESVRRRVEGRMRTKKDSKDN